MFSVLNGALCILAYSVFQFSSTCEATCGQSYFKPYSLTENVGQNRIINGVDARKHSHPWQALVIVYLGKKFKKCGGSLIDWNNSNASDLVVTAAHCVIHREGLYENYKLREEIKFYYKRWRTKDKYAGIPIVHPSQVRVFLGVHDIFAMDENVQRVNVTALTTGLYHQYNRREDVALLKLERRVMYNKFIQGICLPSPNENLPPGIYPCFVTGWGKLDEATSAERLQQIVIDILRPSRCTYLMNRKTMFCAGSKTREIGACSGDSGGPLTCYRNNSFILYGIVSFSMKGICSTTKDPTVFAKVSAFLEWMKAEINHLDALAEADKQKLKNAQR
uniref:Peptidase S1 domain-containing protein n=1 Tax=Trichuris muris TaxID=70415 RepID=A0A5S6QQR6_TRIMR